jgi:ABC-type multidrug transport system ATPase subunit
MVGHGSSLYPDLSVIENTTFWARAAGAAAADGMEALDRLGVESRLRDLPVRMLSAGQRRRVSFAAVLARRPELWLLDEPHSGLDATGRDLVDGLIAGAAAAGATVVFASHELDRAEAVAVRVVRVAGGTVPSDGTAS